MVAQGGHAGDGCPESAGAEQQPHATTAGSRRKGVKMKISQRDAAAMDDLDNALGSGKRLHRRATNRDPLSAAVYRPRDLGLVWRTG
ncbi:hypothetical protein KIF59_14400 [Enterobacter cloacae subsp. cloacae]|nr:hypothetical protein [Enterobacter cloacae subsp. cloacae]